MSTRTNPGTQDRPTLYLGQSGGFGTGPAESGANACPHFARRGPFDHVVFVAPAHAFDRVRRVWRDLRDVEDAPESGAVIVTSPGHAARSDDQEGLDLIDVDPHDLTGLSIVLSKFFDEYDDPSDRLALSFLGLEHFLSYHDPNLVYRFLDSILAMATQRGADVHAHMDTETLEGRVENLLASLFEMPDSEGPAAVAERSGRSTTATESTSSREASPPVSESTEAAIHSGNIPFDPESLRQTASMTDEEIDDFLSCQGHGVLSFDGSPPYAIPISYGYDPDERVAYFHLSAWDDSEKARRFEESDLVSLVVSQFEAPSEWASVVVDGHLSLADDAVDFDRILRVYNKADVATIDVFDTPIDEITVRWFVLEPTQMIGRQSSTWAGDE